MAKLNQMVAIKKGVVQETTKAWAATHHALQQATLFAGLQRTYAPKDEEGERYPAESKNVQMRTKDAVKDVLQRLRELFDVTATIDVTNASGKAVADLVVDGETIATVLPVPYLLWLEKQLTDIHTFVQKFPVLDPAQTWTHDVNRGLFVSPIIETAKTKKVKRALVKIAPTKEHPGQSETYDEDVIVGYWSTQALSSAMPADTVKAMLQRIERLQQAVKFAREAANSVEAAPVKVADKVFRYIFREEV